MTIQNNTIYNDDNINIIDNIPDNSLDGVITDPYFETMSIGNSNATKQDIKSNFIEVARLLFSKLKQDTNFIFFCSTKWMLDNKKMLDDIGYNFNYEIVWNKNRGVSFLTAKKRPLQKHETIFVFSKGSTKYYYDQCKDHGFKKTKRGNYTVKKDYVEIKTNIHNNDGSRFMTTVLDYQVSSYDKQTSHPFEKPSPLCEKLVLAYTKENDLIIDPYSGSGNICKALKSKMRNFIGVETNLKYHTESIANINNTEISPLENVLVNDLFNDVDGRNWAKKWMELVKKDPTIINDEEIMSNWFANAIMTGHDNATKVI